MPEQVEQLRRLLPDDFSGTVLDGALSVLNSGNPIRAHLFAAAMRELMGHLLHLKAPDQQVTAANWYEAVEDRPTRRQRATFAIQGGLSDEMVAAIGLDTEDLHSELAAAHRALNQRTHVRPNTLLTEPDEIENFASIVMTATLEFLGTIQTLRTAVVEAVEVSINEAVFEQFLQSSVGEIDVLATHHSVEGTQVDEIDVVDIGAEEISYRAEGTVFVQLLYGSGSDRARGDGAELSEDFPFSCVITGSVNNLAELHDVRDLDVDTTSWYE